MKLCPRKCRKCGMKNLNLGDVGGLFPFGTVYHVVLNDFTLVQSLETFRLDCRIVDEDIAASFGFNETIALLIVKPLHFTLCHVNFLLIFRNPKYEVLNPKQCKN